MRRGRKDVALGADVPEDLDAKDSKANKVRGHDVRHRPNKIQEARKKAALSRLDPLYQDQRFQVFQPHLEGLAEDGIAAIKINRGVKPVIDLNALFGALPQGGAVPDAKDVALALNAGLGIPRRGLNYANASFWANIKGIADEMQSEAVRANKVLAPLYDNPRLANPHLQQALRDLAANPGAAEIIVRASTDFNVSQFLRKLPEGGGIPTEQELVIALNAGLGLDQRRGLNATHHGLLTPMVHPDAWNHTVRAHRVLTPLYHDPRFEAIQPALRILAEDNDAAQIIADAKHNINVDVFTTHLRLVRGVPNRAQLVDALNAALNLGDRQLDPNAAYINNAFNTVLTRDGWAPISLAMRVTEKLAPLMNDPRFAALKSALRKLAADANAAPIIAAARDNINVNVFLENLSSGGAPFTPESLVSALNAGLDIGGITGLVHDGAYADKLQDVRAAMNTDVVRAHKVLSPLRDTPGFSDAFKTALDNLAKEPDAAKSIAEAKQNIRMLTFFDLLGEPPPTTVNLVAALNASLGITLPEYKEAKPPQAVAEVKNVDPLVPRGIEEPAIAGLAEFEAELKADPYQNMLGRIVDEKAMDAAFYAHKRLAPLYYDTRFANNPRFQAALCDLIDQNKDKIKAREIKAEEIEAEEVEAEAKGFIIQDINVNTFLARLPLRGNPTPEEFGFALNAGLGLPDGAIEYEALRPVVSAIKWSDHVASPRAQQKLAPLFNDPRFTGVQAFKDALVALANQPRAAAIIAAAPHPIDPAAFLRSLPEGGGVPDAAGLVTALNAGLGVRLTVGSPYHGQLEGIRHAMSVTVRANKVLAPLYDDPRFSNPALKEALSRLALNPDIARIIASSPQNFKVNEFLRALLPEGGGVPDAGQLVVALNAGLKIGPNTGIEGLVENNVSRPLLQTILDPGAWDHQVCANKVLARLYDDPRFAPLQKTLRKLAERPNAADLIADAKQNINVNTFLDVISQIPRNRAPNAQDLARALNEALGIIDIAAPGLDHLSVDYGNRIGKIASEINDTIRAHKVLAPLYDDPRFVSLQPALRSLASHPVAATAIAAAGPNFAVGTFLFHLPPTGTPPSPEQLVNALNAALGVRRSLAEGRGYNDELRAICHASSWDDTVRANRVLAPLYYHPRCVALRPTLLELAKQPAIAQIIANGRRLDMNVFLQRLSPLPIDAAVFAVALAAGLGLPENALSARIGSAIAPDRDWNVFNAIAGAPTLVTLRALYVLQPLIGKYQALHVPLTALAEHKATADAIATATQAFNHDDFVGALPAPGQVLDGGALAAAIHSGIQGGVELKEDNHKLQDVIDEDEDTINVLKAKRALLPLINEYPLLGPALTAVAEHRETAAQIATARQEFKLDTFIQRLPLGVGLNPDTLAAAITASLDLQIPLAEHEAVLDRVLHVTDPMNKIKAKRALLVSLELFMTKYPALRVPLTAVANDTEIAAQIATAPQEFKLDDFVRALPAPGVTLDPSRLGAAISAGLGLRQPLIEHGGVLAGVIAVQEPINELKAKRALLPLTAKYPEFTSIAEDKDAAAELAAAQHEFDLDRFVRSLPEPRPAGAWTPDELKDAINAGFQGTTALQEHNNVLQNIINAPANQNTINQLKAKRALLPLIDAYPALGPALMAVANHQPMANQLATATREFNVDAFVRALPVPGSGVRWNADALAAAINAGCGAPVALPIPVALADRGLLRAVLRADPATKNRLKALRALEPLIADPRFASLQTTLRALAANPIAAGHIAASRQEINIAAFLKALPVEGSPPTAEQLAKALDAGLGINTLATNRTRAGVGRGYNTTLKNIVAESVWNNTVRANKVLAPLYYYPEFAPIQATLRGLIPDPAGTLIARGHNINITAFCKALPKTGMAPASEELAHALNVGLGLPEGTLNIADHAAQLDPIRDAMTVEMRAASILQPLLDDPRVESIRRELSTLTTLGTRIMIVAARQQIDVDTFFACLPQGGVIPTEAKLAEALNTSLGITTITHAAQLNPVVTAWNGDVTVRANKILAPLYTDVRFANPNFQAALNALTRDPAAAAIIAAAGRDIDMPAFLSVLPTTERVTAENLTAALNVGLGLLPPPGAPVPAAPPPPPASLLVHAAAYGALINDIAGTITRSMLHAATPVTVSEIKKSMHKAGVDLDDSKPGDRKKIYDIMTVNRAAELKTPVDIIPDADNKIVTKRQIYIDLIKYYVSESEIYKRAPKKDHVEFLDEHVYELKRYLKILEVSATHANRVIVQTWLNDLKDAESNLREAKALLTLSTQALQEQKTRGVYQSWTVIPLAEQKTIVDRAVAKLGAAGAGLNASYGADSKNLVRNLMTAAEANALKDAVFGEAGVGAAPLVLVAGQPYAERDFKHDAAVGAAGVAPADSSFVPVIIPVPAPAAGPAPAIKNVKSVAIQTRDAKSARSDIFIENATTNVPPITRTVSRGLWKSEIKIPGMPVLECAARHVKNFLQIHPTPNNPVITIIRGDMPQALLEAICLYCKYKKINYEPSNVVKLSKDQRNLFAEYWQAKHPEQKKVSAVKADEIVVGIPAPGQRG